MVVVIRLPNFAPNLVGASPFEETHYTRERSVSERHQPVQVVRHQYVAKGVRYALILGLLVLVGASSVVLVGFWSG